MEALFHMTSVTSAEAVSVLISAIWEGAVLVACVALCLRLLPGLSAAARSIVWMNVFLLLVLLQLLPLPAEHWSSDGIFHHSPFQLNLIWSVVIASVWGMLSLWRGAQLILSAIRLHGLATRATPVHADAALKILLQIRGEGEPGRSAELCTSEEVERPCVFGFSRPRILLPPALLERLTALELRQVVLHEIEHLRRADDWSNLLQKLCLMLFPLNPVLLWVERRLCAERELACDDRVLRSNCGRKAYALCLTRLAEYSMLRRSLSLVLGAWERQSELVRRVRRILQRPDASLSGRQTLILTSSLMLGVLAVAIALSRSPRLVSFAPLAESMAQARAIPSPDLREMNLREFGGTPTLVKAEMPRRPLKTAYVSKRKHAPAAPQPSVTSQALPSQTEQVVLTEWQVFEPPPRVLIFISQDRRSSYAAVAMANGWLIVQI
jgi:beta-lactamase regulating signal transducer with metallopeptidase domain